MSSMEGCCKFIEKLKGELYGFIHSAGVLQDSMLMNLTWEKFETVFQSLGNRVSPCQTSGGNQTSLRCFPVFKILTVFYSPISPISPISPSQSPDVSRCLQMSPDVSRCLQCFMDCSGRSIMQRFSCTMLWSKTRRRTSDSCGISLRPPCMATWVS